MRCEYCGSKAEALLPSPYGNICETCAQDMPGMDEYLANYKEESI